MERRNTTRRAELVRWIAREIVQNPGIQVTANRISLWIHVPGAAADRIVKHLVDAGLLKEIAAGVWVRAGE